MSPPYSGEVTCVFSGQICLRKEQFCEGSRHRPAITRSVRKVLDLPRNASLCARLFRRPFSNDSADRIAVPMVLANLKASGKSGAVT
jgi:hypothetical protein